MTPGASLDRRAFLSLSASAMALWLARSVSASATPTNELTRLTLHEAAMRVRNRDVSPVELTQACLARIARYDSKIHAFITVNAELALGQARAAEQEIGQGRWRGPLHGIPIALKDVIDTAGIRTTAARADLVDRVPTQDAEVVTRLKNAGAVVLGKLNLGIISNWGPVHNPWSLDHECAYTSNGAAAALAADFCFGALGTDTGGSIRLPASACGVVGLKPTHGLVSNRGVINDQDALDHAGPLGKTVLDTALLLQDMAGYDPNWVHSSRMDVPDYAAALRQNARRLRWAIPQRDFFDAMDPEVALLVDAALQTLGTIGTRSLDEIHVPGYRESLRDSLAGRCPEGVAPLTLQQARREAAAIFTEGIELLVLPTWKRRPMTVQERLKWSFAPTAFEQELWNTRPFNVLGLPAISVCCGFTKSGLPVGVQIVGRPFAETQVLAFAHAYEQATDWHSRKPGL